jgi:hypothetical protein
MMRSFSNSLPHTIPPVVSVSSPIIQSTNVSALRANCGGEESSEIIFVDIEGPCF